MNCGIIVFFIKINYYITKKVKNCGTIVLMDLIIYYIKKKAKNCGKIIFCIKLTVYSCRKMQGLWRKYLLKNCCIPSRKRRRMWQFV
jgi:hypothetical protein